MTVDEVPESVMLDRMAAIASRNLGRVAADARLAVGRWEPRPCPIDWWPPARVVEVHAAGWSL